MAKIVDAAGKCGLFTDGDWILSENMDAVGTVGVIQLKHVGVGEFHDKEFQFISNSTFNELGCTEVRPGDVLISRMADPIGRACIVPRLPFRAVTAVDVSILRVDESVADRNFITHLCNSQLVRNRIARAARGTTRSRITRTELGETEIPLPPLSEQRQIAERLEQADRLCRTRRYALELADSFLPATFREFFGDARANTKLWDSVTLGEVVIRGPQNGLYKPASAYGAGTPILRIDAFYDGAVTDLDSLKRVRLLPDDIECFGLTENDIVVNRVNSRPYLGKSALIPKLNEPTVFESNMMRFSLNTKSATPVYVTHYLQTSFVKSQIQVLARDAVNQSSINQEDVKGLIVRLPPLPLQQQFAAIVERVECLRAVQREALRQAEHLFASLLDRDFSG